MIVGNRVITCIPDVPAAGVLPEVWREIVLRLCCSYYTYSAPSKEQIRLVRDETALAEVLDEIEGLLQSESPEREKLTEAGGDPQEAERLFFKGPLKGVDMERVLT